MHLRRPHSLPRGISWSADFQSAAAAGRIARRMRVPFGLRAWKPAFPGKSPPARMPVARCAARGAFLWSADFQSAAVAWRRARRMRWPCGLRAWKPAFPGGCSRRGWAFPGARTSSPQGGRRAWRGPCTCPSECGLGSPRSRGPCSRLGISPERALPVRRGGGEHGAAHAPALRPAGLEARVPGGLLSPRRGISWSADFQSAGGAESMARPMHLPFGVRAWKPAFPGGPCSRLGISPERALPVRRGGGEHGAAHALALWPAGLEARVPGGSARGWAFPGARTFSPQRGRRACRGACAGPVACGLGSPRSRENACFAPPPAAAGAQARNSSHANPPTAGFPAAPGGAATTVAAGRARRAAVPRVPGTTARSGGCRP